MQSLVPLFQCTPAAYLTIKVLSASQVYGSLIDNLCRYLAQFEKVPANLELSHKVGTQKGDKT